MVNTHRLKRTRKLLDWIRREHVTASNLCYPMYVTETARAGEVLPEIPYYTLESCLSACEQVCQLGIPAIMVFDIVDRKDQKGTVALDGDGFTARLFRAIKKNFGDDLLIVSNSGICSYRHDGSCLHYGEDHRLLLHETLELIGEISLAHARYGADVIGLPEMVDGQVAAARAKLDRGGFDQISTLSMVKGDSCLFNPFAEAMKDGHGSGEGLLASHQHRTDPLSMDLFAQKIAIEVSEGVDILMIKPASLYLDLVRFVRETYDLPVAAFQVSGEYLMLKLAARSGFFSEQDLFYEAVSCMKRAGAQIIVTYQALQLARGLAAG